MKEQGTTTRIDGSVVTLRIDLEANCAGCMNKEGCGLAGSLMKARDPSGLVSAPGQRVEVEISPGTQAAGAFWLLGLPLVLFGGGYAAGSVLFPSSGEGPAALLGIGGFALGILAAFLLKRGTRTASLPAVTRVLEPAYGSEYRPAPAADEAPVTV